MFVIKVDSTMLECCTNWCIERWSNGTSSIRQGMFWDKYIRPFGRVLTCLDYGARE